MGSVMGIPPTYLGLLGIFTGVVVIVLSIGWMYDVTFGLWREHLTVVQERNPFTTYKLNAPFGIILAQTNTILRKVSEDDEEVQRQDFTNTEGKSIPITMVKRTSRQQIAATFKSELLPHKSGFTTVAIPYEVELDLF